MLQQVQNTLSVHPCSTLAGLLSDQIRLDEVRLRATNHNTLPEKRVALLRDLLSNVLSFRSNTQSSNLYMGVEYLIERVVYA